MARAPKWFRGAFGVTQDGHLTKMGVSQSLFWWAVARQTPHPSPESGWVLGGREIRRSEVADDLQVGLQTVSRMIDKQVRLGYLERQGTAHGFRLRVRNQKKFKEEASPSSEEGNPPCPQVGIPEQTTLPTTDNPGDKPDDPLTCTSSTGTRSQLTNNSLRVGAFESESTPAVKKKSRKQPNPITPFADDALNYFREIYPKVLGKADGSKGAEYFVSWPRDRAILIALIRGHGLNHVRERILAFWRLKHRMLKHPDQRYNPALNRVHGADNSIPGLKYVYDTLPTLWAFETDARPWKADS